MSRRSLNARELIAKLEQTRSGDAALCFDADGTLWSGDVGEDAYHRALGEGLIRDEALDALREMARRFAVSLVHTPNELARALWVSYTAGQFPEREICEVMTWCYAGWSVARFRAFAARVVQDSGLRSRLRSELLPIIEWAKLQNLRMLVVSASPRVLVEEGARLWGFAAHDVIAASPALDGDRIAPRMDGPVPYAQTKCELARPVIGDAQWLASFGDNVFDIDMLRAARIGIAVEPKPLLAERLPELDSVYLLTKTV